MEVRTVLSFLVCSIRWPVVPLTEVVNLEGKADVGEVIKMRLVEDTCGLR